MERRDDDGESQRKIDKNQSAPPSHQNEIVPFSSTAAFLD